MLGPPLTLPNLSLRQLEVFEAVARNLSFTKAARELHLSQPAVSMLIKELETGCQLALFERLNRGITLTAAGQELARCAQAVAEQLRFTRENLDAQRGVKTGLLTLGAVSTAKYFAPALLSAFQAKYPGVSIRFAVGNRHDMINQLADNRVDLMFMGRPPPELQTVAMPFAKHPLVIVAAPAHRLAAKRRIPLRELAKESFLIREDGSGTRAAMEQLFAAGGVRYHAAMELSSNETIKQAVIANMGISFLSFHTVGLELEAKRLVVLDVVGLPVVRDWFVIHRAEKRLSPTARAFREFVLAEARELIAQGIGSLAPPEKRPRRTR